MRIPYATIIKGLVLIMIASAFRFIAVAQNNLQPYQKAAIATRFASEVKYNFAGYGRFAQDFDSICRAELPSIVNTATDEEFNQQLQLLANRLHDGHTSIGYTADVTYAPISQKRFGDKVFVTGVYSDEYTQKGVKSGTEIIAINGVPVIEYGNKYVVPYIPSSTEQWSKAYPFNSENLTKGKRGEPITITFQNKGGKPFDIVDQRQSPWGIVNPDMAFKYSTLQGNIGLLRIPSFRANNFDINRFADVFDKEISHNNGLIIDIRDNTGGNSQIGGVLMMLLATDSIPNGSWDTPRYDAAYASWGQGWHTVTEPGQKFPPYFMQTNEVPKYDKPIVLLINSGTFSAAENFAALFRNCKRGLIIGTPTGGSTGNPINIDLGWGYYGRICTRQERLADGTEFIGVGIQPDIVIEENENVIFGNDNVIEQALKMIKE